MDRVERRRNRKTVSALVAGRRLPPRRLHSWLCVPRLHSLRRPRSRQRPHSLRRQSRKRSGTMPWAEIHKDCSPNRNYASGCNRCRPRRWCGMPDLRDGRPPLICGSRRSPRQFIPRPSRSSQCRRPHSNLHRNCSARHRRLRLLQPPASLRCLHIACLPPSPPRRPRREAPCRPTCIGPW